MDIIEEAKTLVRLLQEVLASPTPNGSFALEMELNAKLRRIRNGPGSNVWDTGDYGIIFDGISMPKTNEEKFSRCYETIFAINKLDQNDAVISKFDDHYNSIIQKMNSDTKWYDLTEAELTASITPPCIIGDFDYIVKRSEPMLARDGKLHDKLPSVYMMEEKDREIYVNNDRYIDKRKKTTPLKTLRFRFREELNPYYSTHPVEILLVNTLVQKVQNGGYFNYGLRYLELVMLSMKSETFPFLHLPIEFKSNGQLVTPQWHSHFVLQFRYVLNLQSLMLHNVNIHRYEEKYILVSNELLNYVLIDPYVNGKFIKKTFTAVNLYYGMDVKASEKLDYKLEENMHKHPKYACTEYMLTKFPSEYIKHETCDGCSSDLDRAVYSQKVRDYVQKAMADFRQQNLPILADYIDKKLLPVRSNLHIIEDIIFIRMHTSAGGYAHSHKLRDFIPAIEKAVIENDRYCFNQEQNDVMVSLSAALYNVGLTQTKNLLPKYPDPHAFKAGYAKYLTSKSAGLAPIIMNIEAEANGRKQNIKLTSTSKATRAAVTGREIFDLSRIHSIYDGVNAIQGSLTPQEMQELSQGNVPLSVAEKLNRFDYVRHYYDSLAPHEQDRIRTHGLSETDLGILGISRIGSRATAGFRAIRAIFMMRLESHILQCSIVQPHIDATSRSYSDAEVPQTFWINDVNYGYAIYTQQQSQSDDIMARYVMASASGNYIVSCADCSAWDQHVKCTFLNAYYQGIQSAFSSEVALEHKHYMVKHGHGLDLAQCTNEFQKFQVDGRYIAEYGDEASIVNTNFLTSGRLDTFMFNSIQNIEINHIIHNKFSQLIGPKVEYVALTVAGDDMISLLKPHNGRIRSNNVEEYKDIILSHYRDAGHDVSAEKTILANRSFEFAKRYGYRGFTFRDPNIQFFESEKNNKAESFIDVMRGQAQKQFEAYRRSCGDSQVSMIAMRLFFGLAYKLKVRQRNDVVRNTNVNYYPPYPAVIIPTSVSGGLGCSFTGVSQNEELFLQRHLIDIINAALPITSILTFNSNKEMPTGLIRHILPESKLSLHTNVSGNLKINRVEVTSNNTSDVPMDIRAGLEHKKTHASSMKSLQSTQALERLKRLEVNVPEKLKYENDGYINFIQFADTLNSRRGADDIDAVNNVSSIFDIKGRRIMRKIPTVTLASLYDIYSAILIELTLEVPGEHHFEHTVPRNVSSPSSGRLLERIYGSRYGKSAYYNFDGLNQQLQKFITKTGVPFTSQQLLDTLLGVAYDVNSSDTDNVMLDLLIAVSGDDEAATQTIHDLQSHGLTWGDMLTAATLAGSLVDYLDSSKENLKKYVVSNLTCDSRLQNMYKYSTFLYMLQYNSWFFRFHSLATSAQIRASAQSLRVEAKLASKRVLDNRKQDVTYLGSLYKLYNEHKVVMQASQSTLIDENSM